jgi:4-amino-4-deoxy-L-arabinose transferase-like glycosyltransferase
MGKRLLVIVLFAIVIWVPGYLRRDVWQPDEARYAYVAQEMRTGNHWFVPHRHGVFYAHKPPLMFWLINAGSLVTGGNIGKLATRLPSLLGVILALWAVGGITRLWVNQRTAWLATFITATTFAIWWRAGWGQIDMLLCGLQMTALWLLFEDDQRRTLWRPLLAYCFFGLGILAKGPVGLLVPLGAYITANLVAGTKKNLRRWHWVWGLFVTLLWPALWLVLAKAEGAPAAYFNEILLKQNANRAAGGFGHLRPFYYYLQYLLVDGLPWILMLPFCLVGLVKHGADKHLALRRAVGWFGFIVLFFSLLPTKRSLYILLAYPALAVIVATGWPLLRELPRKALWVAASLLASMLAVAAITLAVAPWITDVPLSRAIAVPGAVMLLVAALSIVLRFRCKGPEVSWFSHVVVVFAGFYLFVATAVLPQFNAMKTPVALVTEVQKRMPEGKPLLLYKINAEIMPYYCERPGEVFWGDHDFWVGMIHHKRGIAVFLESEWEKHKAQYGKLGETGRFEMGHKRYVWLDYTVIWPKEEPDV